MELEAACPQHVFVVSHRFLVSTCFVPIRSARMSQSSRSKSFDVRSFHQFFVEVRNFKFSGLKIVFSWRRCFIKTCWRLFEESTERKQCDALWMQTESQKRYKVPCINYPVRHIWHLCRVLWRKPWKLKAKFKATLRVYYGTDLATGISQCDFAKLRFMWITFSSNS